VAVSGDGAVVEERGAEKNRGHDPSSAVEGHGLGRAGLGRGKERREATNGEVPERRLPFSGLEQAGVVGTHMLDTLHKKYKIVLFVNEKISRKITDRHTHGLARAGKNDRIVARGCHERCSHH
jgi:hypothetical protein